MTASVDYIPFLKKIVKLNEDQLRHLIVNFFRKQGFLADDTHGSGEHGADVIVVVRQQDDPLGIGQVIFIQVKAKEISLPAWRSDKISGQLTELLSRPPMLLNTDKTLSRRIVFITSGTISQEVVKYIIYWNDRNSIPIEALDGKRFARLLSEKDYKLKHFVNDIKPQDIARPIQNTDRETIQEILGRRPLSSINVKKLGNIKEKVKSEVVGTSKKSKH